ncbi:MAG TPA: formate dehydrogenase subunit alpha [Syntrophaceae bacterium]|nr:formate dehydrogenase subunit alpha [Syntrophaceae bacterium]
MKTSKPQRIKTICPYCGCGCNIILHVQDNRVSRVTVNPNKPPNFGRFCVKGASSHVFISHPDRLRTPLIRKGRKFVQVSWDEALSLVAQRFLEIKDKYGPDSIGSLGSAKCTNEENYLIQKFMRAVIGTNNVDHCARLCHSSTVAGLIAALGSGAMTNSIAEIEKADVILVTGSNTPENHPIIAMKIWDVITNKGKKLMVVDPRMMGLASYADIWLNPRPGTDVAWLNGMMHIIIAEDLWDKTYVLQRTENFGALKEVVKRYTPELVEKITGIPANDLIKAARLYAQAERACIIYAMGITQHVSGTDNVKAIANLAMLCGNVGIEGGGVNPLRGQNNVQGACDMGVLPNVLPGYQSLSHVSVIHKFEEAWKVKLPRNPGLTATEMLEAARQGKIKALYIIGDNPLVSGPDLKQVEDSLKGLDFLVVQDIFLTETAKLATAVLPAVSFAEKDGTFTNTERRIQMITEAVPPQGDAKPDWKIICELAQRMGYNMNYKSPKNIMEEIANLTPIYGGIHYSRLEKMGLQWPCPDKNHPGTPYLHKDRFTRGLGLFQPVEFMPSAELPDKDYPFILSTGRVLYHYNTGTMSRRTQILKEKYPEALMEINPKDAMELGIEDKSLVEVCSRRGRVTVRVRITDISPPGVVFIPFHFREAAANLLTIAALDPISKIPEYKVCAVSIKQVESASQT